MRSRKQSSTHTLSSVRSLLLVAPTRRELRGITPSPPVVHTGVVGLGNSAGPELSKLIQRTQPDLVVSIGFAGALLPSINSGDVILCDSVRFGTDTQDPRLDLDLGPRHLITSLLAESGLKVRNGALITVAYPVIHAMDKHIHGSRTGAAAVEMEGYSLAVAANREHIPIVMLRAILDPVSRELPRVVARIIEDHGRNEWRHTLRALACDPGLIVTLLRLAREARLASRSLAVCGRTIKYAFLGG